MASPASVITLWSGNTQTMKLEHTNYTSCVEENYIEPFTTQYKQGVSRNAIASIENVRVCEFVYRMLLSLHIYTHSQKYK